MRMQPNDFQDKVLPGDLVLLTLEDDSRIPLFYTGPAQFLFHSEEPDLLFTDIDSQASPPQQRLYTLDLSSLTLGNGSPLGRVNFYEILQRKL